MFSKLKKLPFSLSCKKKTKSSGTPVENIVNIDIARFSSNKKIKGSASNNHLNGEKANLAVKISDLFKTE